jgi:hypothetical protein
MNDAIPHHVLSDQIRSAIGERTVISAVFLTFRFDPAFFERHILPVFFDLPVSQGEGILGAIQLEQSLKEVRHGVAIYYDAGGLHQGEPGSAKLDVRRIRVKRANGYFHPKNIFVLVETCPDEEDRAPERSLLIVTLSANLTRAGWWENVEGCHVEEIPEGGQTRMKDALLGLYQALEGECVPGMDHRSLRAIRDFTQGLAGRAPRQDNAERLLPLFYGGNEPVLDFLRRAAGAELRQMRLNLEIVSPYFDESDHSQPLEQLIRAFSPMEVRVFLPRDPDGNACVNAALYEHVRTHGVARWGKLPRSLMKSGSPEDARDRFVHAKVYRFFQVHPKKEYLFIGSVNLTRAAHQGSANLETGVFVEVNPAQRPDFWLSKESVRPLAFNSVGIEDEATVAEGRTPLSLRHSWRTHQTFAYWDANEGSPPLTIQAQGELLFVIDPLPAGEWTTLPDAQAARLEGMLPSTAVVEVTDGKRPPAPLLIEEEDMHKKPSLITALTLAQILKYWAQLTPEQRTTYLDGNFPALADARPNTPTLPISPTAPLETSVFDRFAGIFHAFHCLERTILNAIAADNLRDAESRLFGRHIDSLGFLLERLMPNANPKPEDQTPRDEHDDVDRYVMFLCAQQLCDQVERQHRAFWNAHRDDVAELNGVLAKREALRDALVARNPPGLDAFLSWFERWFLIRAKRKAATDQPRSRELMA